MSRRGGIGQIPDYFLRGTTIDKMILTLGFKRPVLLTNLSFRYAPVSSLLEAKAKCLFEAEETSD